MDIYSKEYTHHSRSLGRTVSFRRNTARNLLVAFAIAALLHGVSLLVLLATGLLEDKAMIDLTLAPYETLEEIERAYMEMQNPPTLVDVPEEASVEEPPDDPDADVADRNAIARDLLEETELPEGPAYAEGDLEIRTMEDPNEEDEERPEPFAGGVPLTPRQGGIEDFQELEDPPMWTSDLIIRPEFRGSGGGEGRGEGGTEGDVVASAPRPTGPEAPVHIPQDDLNELAQMARQPAYERHRRFGFGLGNSGPRVPRTDNRHTSVKDYGDFSLSTYAWDYAPYLYILRERIRRRWFAPEAFNMGLVSGRVIIRFKIMPDGALRDLEVLSYRDNDIPYQSLVASSRNAIESSSPFPPLPVDFHHPYLEITGTFYYQILRAR